MKISASVLLLMPCLVLSAPYVHPYRTLVNPLEDVGQNLEIEVTFDEDTGESVIPEAFRDVAELSTDQTPTTSQDGITDDEVTSGMRQIDSQPATYYTYPTKIPFRGEVVLTNRERKKQERIRQIRNKMMELRPQSQVVFNVSHIKNEPLLNLIKSLVHSTQRPQFRTVSKNILPSCMTPMNTPLSMWENESNSIKIYFNLESLDLQDVNVEEASLRLYKKRLDYSSYDYVSEDRIRVSTFRFKNPLRRNRQPRRLLEDSVMLSVNEVGWVSLDLKRAASHWFNSPRRNFGLEIDVEDQHGHLVNSEDLFFGTNCSDHPVEFNGEEMSKPSTTALPTNNARESNKTVTWYLSQLTPSYFTPKLYLKLTSGHINLEPTIIGAYDEDDGVKLYTEVLPNLQLSSTPKSVEQQEEISADNDEYLHKDTVVPTDISLTEITEEETSTTTSAPNIEPSSTTISQKRSNRRKHHKKHHRSHRRRHNRLLL